MLCVPALTLDVGRVTSIENNHREVPSAKKGTSVSIKISNESNPQMTYGRQFDHTHTLYRSVAGECEWSRSLFFFDSPYFFFMSLSCARCNFLILAAN
jgi:hypothetical protein